VEMVTVGWLKARGSRLMEARGLRRLKPREP